MKQTFSKSSVFLSINSEKNVNSFLMLELLVDETDRLGNIKLSTSDVNLEIHKYKFQILFRFREPVKISFHVNFDKFE